MNCLDCCTLSHVGRMGQTLVWIIELHINFFKTLSKLKKITLEFWDVIGMELHQFHKRKLLLYVCCCQLHFALHWIACATSLKLSWAFHCLCMISLSCLVKVAKHIVSNTAERKIWMWQIEFWQCFFLLIDMEFYCQGWQYHEYITLMIDPLIWACWLKGFWLPNISFCCCLLLQGDKQ